MTTTFGFTDQGLVAPTLADIRADMNARIWKSISTTLDLSDRSLEGFIVGIVSEALARVWEQLELVAASWDPDKAVGIFLEALAALTGTVAPPPSKSAVVLTLTGTPSSVVPAGDQVRVPDGPSFALSDTATILAVLAWVTATNYALADRVTSGGGIYQCTTAGTSGGAGPTSTDVTADIVDGSVHWRYLGAGTGAVDVLASCTVTGPSVANSATITEIVTAEGGWDGVINVLDASVGRDKVTSAQLRALRELELAQPGTGTPGAIQAALLSVTGVTNVTIFENDQDTTSTDGIPPHAVEAMVRGGEDQDIWDALRDNVAAGIRTHGSVTGSSTDSQGTAHVEKFTRPTEIPVYVAITLVKDPATYPADGDAQVRSAIADWGDGLSTGRDITSSAVLARVFDVAGVLEVVHAYIGTAPAPATTTTIPVTLRQLATFDTSRITVTTSDGVP